jgi:hypothetical protein
MTGKAFFTIYTPVAVFRTRRRITAMQLFKKWSAIGKAILFLVA